MLESSGIYSGRLPSVLFSSKDDTGATSTAGTSRVRSADPVSLALRQKCIEPDREWEQASVKQPVKRSVSSRSACSASDGQAKRIRLNPAHTPVQRAQWGDVLKADDIEQALYLYLGIVPARDRLLGHGAFGRVERWYELVADEFYAVKVAKDSVTSQQGWSELNMKEVNGLLCHEHPNIARTLAVLMRQPGTMSFCLVNDPSQIPRAKAPAFKVCALVSEYVEGIDLFCAQRGCSDMDMEPLPDFAPSPELAIRILAPVSEALASLHEQGLVYRDLKPENIVISKVESRYIPKLVDFGLCKPLEKGQRTSSFVGTPEFCAPELLLRRYNVSAPDYDHKVDAWSLGVVLIELIGGKCLRELDLPGIRDRERTSLPERVRRFGQMTDSEKRRFLTQHVHSFRHHAPLLDLIVDLTRINPEQRISVSTAAERLSKLAEQ